MADKRLWYEADEMLESIDKNPEFYNGGKFRELNSLAIKIHHKPGFALYSVMHDNYLCDYPASINSRVVAQTFDGNAEKSLEWLATGFHSGLIKPKWNGVEYTLTRKGNEVLSWMHGDLKEEKTLEREEQLKAKKESAALDERLEEFKQRNEREMLRQARPYLKNPEDVEQYINPQKLDDWRKQWDFHTKTGYDAMVVAKAVQIMEGICKNPRSKISEKSTRIRGLTGLSSMQDCIADALVVEYCRRGEAYRNYRNGQHVSPEQAKEMEGLVNPNVFVVRGKK